MATGTAKATATRSGLLPYRITVRQYLKMIDAGVFPEGAHVELLGGMIHDKMTKKTPHNYAIDQLADLLGDILPPGWIARQEKSVVLGRYWRPEPDIVVVPGPRKRYRRRDPKASELGILIEVADSSYPTDR